MRHEDIESMKNRPVPEGLAERITARLLKHNSGSAPARRKRPLAFAGAATAFAAIAVMGVVSTRPAAAARIGEIHAAFSQPLACTIRSYQIGKDGTRTLVGRTEIDGENVKFILYGPDGKEQELEPILQEFKQNLDKLIAEQPAGQIAQPGELEKLVKLSAQGDQASLPPLDSLALSPQSVNAEMLVEQITQLTSALKELMTLLETLEKSSNTGAMVAGGKSGPQYTRQLLSDEDLWDRRPDVVRDGQKLNHFVLKGGLERFEIFVKPDTKLPVYSRLDLSTELFPFIVEDVYDYRPLSNQQPPRGK